MGQSTTDVQTLVRDVSARIDYAEPVLSDELERHIATTVAAGWRPARLRRGRRRLVDHLHMRG